MAKGNFTELKQRLLFVLGALVVFRIGTFVPVPGVDPTVLSILFDQQKGGILGVFNMFSGGALGRMSMFALGIMPYISASIIMQLLAVTVPKLEQLRCLLWNSCKKRAKPDDVKFLCTPVILRLCLQLFSQSVSLLRCRVSRFNHSLW